MGATSSDDKDIGLVFFQCPHGEEMKVLVITESSEAVKAAVSVFWGRALKGEFATLINYILKIISPVWCDEALIDFGIRENNG